MSRALSGPFVSDDIECFRHLALEPWNGAGYLVVARSLPQTRYTLLNIRAPPWSGVQVFSVMFHTQLKRRMCVVVRQVPYAFALRASFPSGKPALI
jgi:hypothetical protein